MTHYTKTNFNHTCKLEAGDTVIFRTKSDTYHYTVVAPARDHWYLNLTGEEAREKYAPLSNAAVLGDLFVGNYKDAFKALLFPEKHVLDGHWPVVSSASALARCVQYVFSMCEDAPKEEWKLTIKLKPGMWVRKLGTAYDKWGYVFCGDIIFKDERIVPIASIDNDHVSYEWSWPWTPWRPLFAKAESVQEPISKEKDLSAV